MPEQHQPIPLPTQSAMGITARRIRFVPQLPANTKARREFRQPRSCYAFEEAVELANLPRDRTWPEPTDSLLVLYVPSNAPADWQNFGAEWMMPGEHSEAVQPVVIQGRGRQVQWRPGRALIVGDRPPKSGKKGPPETGMPEDLLAALIDFSFHEAELRNLELAVKIGESRMQDDISKVYKVRIRDRSVWPHFTEMIEYFERLILVHSLLEPRLVKPSRTLPRLSRRWAQRLCQETDIEERLDDLNSRLEIGEALYEGASDRVSDYKGYHIGHVLEVIIVFFLILEVIVMGLELKIAHENHVLEEKLFEFEKSRDKD